MNSPRISTSATALQRDSNNSSSNYSGVLTSPTGASSTAALLNLDFRSIDELDPSIADGHRPIFDKEVPVELRTMDNMKPNESSLEAVRVKVLVLGDANEITNVRMELSSETDLFFHYFHSLSADSYADLQQKQRLMTEFQEYQDVLIRMLNYCIREPQTYLAVFVMSNNGTGQFDFIQNMEYKFLELLSIGFEESPQHVVRQHISFRYNSLKSRLAMMQARLQDVSNLVKVKNPSLLLQLQRTSSPSRTPNPSVNNSFSSSTMSTPFTPTSDAQAQYRAKK